MDVAVITDDRMNRLPRKVSLAEVCDAYGIEWITLAEFPGTNHLGIPRTWTTKATRHSSKARPSAQTNLNRRAVHAPECLDQELSKNPRA